MAMDIFLIPVFLIILCQLEIISSQYCAVFSGIFVIIIVYLLLISQPNYRVATSQVLFCDDHLEVCDRRGRVWRTIHYSDITSATVVDMAGFMHGYHGVSGIAKYIVLFCNGCTVLPEGSYRRKFTDPGSFPIYYQTEVFDILNAHLKQCDGGNAIEDFD